MRRVLYVAGINRKHLADAADACPYWLLSVSLFPRTGPPAWLLSRLRNRRVRWDPGTFSAEARPYKHYREWLERYARPGDDYLSYDEIGGDPHLNTAYFYDLERRGFRPIPIYHRGMDLTNLYRKGPVALGGLVPMSDRERMGYLDEVLFRMADVRFLWPFYRTEFHLLGIGQPEWFRRYPVTSGDSTTWIPRFPWNQTKAPGEWLKAYGEQEIPYEPPSVLQERLFG